MFDPSSSCPASNRPARLIFDLPGRKVTESHGGAVPVITPQECRFGGNRLIEQGFIQRHFFGGRAIDLVGPELQGSKRDHRVCYCTLDPRGSRSDSKNPICPSASWRCRSFTSSESSATTFFEVPGSFPESWLESRNEKAVQLSRSRIGILIGLGVIFGS